MRQTRQIFILTLFFAGISLSQPKLSLSKPEIDLGTIYSGMKKQGRIVLKNIGNDTLRIYSVQPSCGCTAVKQPKAFLLPSESDVAEVEFNSSGYHGKVEKHINITTNDPLSQNVSIKLLVDVKEELESTSHSSLLWLGNIGLGKTFVQETSLKNVSNHIIRIKNFTTSSSSINIKIEKKMLAPNDTLTIRVTIKPEKLGYGSDYFTIETDSKNQPHVEIRGIVRMHERELTLRQAFIEALLLVIAAMVLGVSYTFVAKQGFFAEIHPTHSQTLSNIEMISLEMAKELFDSSKALFIDARHESEYQAGRIRGAVNIPLKKYDTHRTRLDAFSKDTLLVVYCDGAECSSSVELAVKLMDSGFTNVKVFFGGWQEWISAKLPTEK